MIYDRIENIGLYRGISRNLDIALDWIDATNPNGLEKGILEIDGRTTYSVCSEYTTRPYAPGKFEAHRKYIDVQMILAGRERIDVAFLHKLEVTEGYDGEKDALLAEGKKDCHFILEPGYFCIFFPGDAHMPGTLEDSKQVKVRKLVLKVHV